MKKTDTNKFNSYISNTFSVVFLTLVLFSSTSARSQNTSRKNFEIAKNIDLFCNIYKNIDLLYVDSINTGKVMNTAIDAMLDNLDPYTEYYAENNQKDLRMMISGKYGGIGSLIRYDMQKKCVMIDQPYEHMPAAEVGLKRGDIILAIDDSTMKGKDNAYVSEHLRGTPGSTFLLKVKRPSTGKTLKFKITRRNIKLPAVPYYALQKDNIGYIALSSFTEDCSKDVKKAFIDLKQKGIKKLILDLRNNTGGSEDEAVNIVGLFVSKGTLVVSNRGKRKEVCRDLYTTQEPIDTIMPIIVLVNGSSASASEITCGALQDLDRAVIMGTRTYGKGLVQATLSTPYNGTLKITTAKYYIPSGRCIQKIKYKHEEGGYKAEKVNTQKTQFYTANKRIVSDGNGIMPDVEVKADSLSNIAFYLVAEKDSNEVVWNYETDYINSHKTITPAANFLISDADYQDFKQRVINSKFKYETASQKIIKQLIKTAKNEAHNDELMTQLKLLEEKLIPNIEKELDKYSEQIKKIISNDIVSAYYFQRGTIENSLSNDKQLKEAHKLLNNIPKYKQLLMPNKDILIKDIKK